MSENPKRYLDILGLGSLSEEELDELADSADLSIRGKGEDLFTFAQRALMGNPEGVKFLLVNKVNGCSEGASEFCYNIYLVGYLVGRLAEREINQLESLDK